MQKPGLPFLIKKKPFKTVKVVNPRHFQAVRLTNSRLSRFSFQIRTGSAGSPGCRNPAGFLASFVENMGPYDEHGGKTHDPEFIRVPYLLWYQQTINTAKHKPKAQR